MSKTWGCCLSKDVTTYWNKTSSISNMRNVKRSKNNCKSRSATPQWFVFTVIVAITFLLCLAINFRAFSDMRRQSIEYTSLNTEIDKLTTENLVLQEEIRNLKHDPRTIEREARKIGMSRPNEKILVPIY